MGAIKKLWSDLQEEVHRELREDLGREPSDEEVYRLAEERMLSNYEQIQPGDRVRSFDFAYTDEDLQTLTGERACYVEGIVTAITDDMEGCRRYKIKKTRQVIGGEEATIRDEYCYPPLNGTRIWGDPDRRTRGVVLLEKAAAPGYTDRDLHGRRE